MLLGIEIESSSVKVALMKKKNELLQWEIFELPAGVISSEGIVDIDILINVLSKIPSKFNMKQPKIGFAISGPTYSAVRILNLPYIDKDELALNLPMELDKHIPFSIKEVYYDFHIIGHSKESSEVIVASATKQIVNEFITAFERAGMIPVLVDIGSLALYNVYEANYNESSTVALMNIGENVINFIIANKNKPLYIRDSYHALKISEESASEEQIRSMADEISAEIYRQIEYFKSITSGETVKKIYITGFPVNYPVFLASIEERLEQPIFMFNPFKNIKINKKIIEKMQINLNLASISVGVSLRGTEKLK